MTKLKIREILTILDGVKLMSSILKMVTLIAVLVTLSGCASLLNPYKAPQNKLPSNLTDDIHYPALKGNYTKPVPKQVQQCVQEANNRAYDVFALIKAIHENNAEMQAIRQLNNYASEGN